MSTPDEYEAALRRIVPHKPFVLEDGTPATSEDIIRRHEQPVWDELRPRLEEARDRWGSAFAEALAAASDPDTVWHDPEAAQ